jgi:hypothetical protein
MPEKPKTEYEDHEVLVNGFGLVVKGNAKLYKKGDIVSLPVNHGKAFKRFVKPVHKGKN